MRVGVGVGIEQGPKRRVFAQAVDWPGWCRAGRDADKALTALAAYLPRYRAAVGGLAADLPAGEPTLEVIETVAGDVTTEFGAPGKVMTFDRRPLQSGEPERLAAFLDACWAAFDAAQAAIPAEARAVKPEVGRAPERMRMHIDDAQRAYVSWLAKPVPRLDEARLDETESALRGFFRAAVLSLPVGVAFADERHPGPYAVRRECWHVLDHVWELGDRAASASG